MQPISAASINIPESRLDQVPREVRLNVFEYLQHDCANLELMNKTWKKHVSNEVWIRFAKQLNLEATPENAKQKVLDECKYRSIVEVFFEHVEVDSEFNEQLQQGKTATEKYSMILSKMQEDSLEGRKVCICFFYCVCEKDRLSKNEILAIKEFINDEAQDFAHLLGTDLPLSLFRYVLKKYCNPLEGTATNVDNALQRFCRFGSSLQKIKIICDHGFLQPNIADLEAAIGFPKRTQVLLDYCDEGLRSSAIQEFQTRAESPYFKSKYEKGIELIKSAPSPTFGAGKIVIKKKLTEL